MKGGKALSSFVNSFICQYPMKWFPIQIVRTEVIDPSKQYTFGLHPHGLMPWGLFPVGRTKQWNELFPGLSIRCLAADVLFKIPIAREATILAGGVSCHFKSASYVLEEGHSIAVIPGGVAEMLESEPSKEVLVLKNRKGFVRLAITNGTDLVPCYCFGVTDLYAQFQYMKDFRSWLLKKTRIGFTFGWGRSFYNILPKKRPLLIVVGKPIEVKKCSDPSEEQIDEIHKRYMQSLVDLYYNHRDSIDGYKGRELTVL